MKRQQILEKDIDSLKIDNKIISVLRNNNVNKVENIWELKRRDLKNLGLSDSEISQIAIKLQLYGLDLNKKVY